MTQSNNTLFQKDSKLFIRLEDGEYEVSNPEVFEEIHIPLGVTYGQYFANFSDGIGWYGDVEFVYEKKVSETWILCFKSEYNGSEDFRKLVKLLPMKENCDQAKECLSKPPSECKCFTKPVPPSETQEEQEELWKEARHYIDVWRIEELFKRFTITRK